jgi:hypothetical protein
VGNQKLGKSNLKLVDGQEALILIPLLNTLINKNHYHLKNSILLEKQKMNLEDVDILKEFFHLWNIIITSSSSFKEKDP